LTLSREEQHLVNLMGLHESTILHSILSSKGARVSSTKLTNFKQTNKFHRNPPSRPNAFMPVFFLN
jgi:hypothetical protein